MIRMPAPRAYLSALRERTKFGSVVLSEERFAKLVDAVFEFAEVESSEIVGTLEKYGLKPDDLNQLFAGELGYAVAMMPRDGRNPLAVGFAWVEPGEDLAGRVIAAIEQVVEEQMADDPGMRRVDLELAGHRVIHLSATFMDVDREFDPELFPADAFEGDFDADALQARMKEQLERRGMAESIQVDQSNVFLTAIGGRLLLAHTFPQSEQYVRRQLAEAPDRRLDFDEVSGAERVAGAFSQILAAHEGGGGGEFIARIMAAPGVAANLPDGIPLVEMFADIKGIIRAIADELPDVATTLERLGLDGLDAFAYRDALDERTIRDGVVLSMPAPRRGVLQLLEQTPVMPVPPEWVPRDVVGYGYVVFDWATAYERIREMAVAEGGEMAAQYFQMADQQLNGVIQTDVATLLKSIGAVHHVVSFESQVEAVDVEQIQEDISSGVFEAPEASGRVAIVLTLNDESPWNRLMQLAGGFAAMSQGAVQPAEEQGFTGFRIEVPPVHAGLFVGRGHMVLGVGADVISPVLAAIRTPPAESLAGSPLIERASALLPPRPATWYQVVDSARQIREAHKTWTMALDLFAAASAMPGGIGDEATAGARAAFIKAVREWIPPVDELQSMFDVSVVAVSVEDEGLIVRAAQELPAP